MDERRSDKEMRGKDRSPTMDERWTDIDLQAALSRASQPMFLLNERGSLVFANPALHKLFEVPIGNRIGWRELESGPLKPPHDLHAGGARQLDVRLPSGAWMQVVFHSLTDASSGSIGVLGILRAIDVRPAAPPSDENLFARWERLREDQRQRFGFDASPARSDAGAKLVQQLKIASQIDSPVLFLGEPGVGKKTLARALHHHAKDRGWSALLDAEALNPEEQQEFLFGETGVLRQPGPGRLIVRRLLSMPLENQKSLVEAHETPGREWRLLATEREPLDAAFADGRLNAPLFHLLTRFVIQVPPLRERREDIPHFIAGLLKAMNASATPTTVAIAVLERYDWPGNLRELAMALSSAADKCGGSSIDIAHLPPRIVRGTGAKPPIVKPIPLDEQLERHERKAMRRAHGMFRGNKTKAAEHLGLSRARFIRRWEQLAMDGADDSRADIDLGDSVAE
jgi:transcriptional regulator with PAS, ATPase and Fis domain